MKVLAMFGFALVYGAIFAVVDVVLGIEFATSVPMWGRVAHNSVAFLGGAIFAITFNNWKS